MKDPIGILLGRVRRRLWRARAGVGLRHAVWVGGLGTIAVGALHRWLLALPLPAALTLALAPALIVATVIAARGRPTPAQTARHADRVLGTLDLFASALEIGRRTDSQRAAPSRLGPLVVARAAATASARLAAPRTFDVAATSRARAAVTLPLALGFVGAFLMLNRGAELEAPLRTQAAARAAADAPAPTGTALDLNGDRSETSERRERPMAESEGIVLPDPLEDDGPRPLFLPDVSGSQAGANAEELGKLPASGRPPPRVGETVKLPEMEVRIVRVDSLGSAPEAAVGSDGVALDPTADETARVSGAGSTRVQASRLGDLNPLTAEERRLAERYFGLARDAPEANAD